MGLFKFLKDKFGKNKDAKSSSLENTKEVGLAGVIENNDQKSSNFSEQISLDKYDKGLEKSRKNFSSKLDALTKKYRQVNEDYFSELEEILIEADCGVSFALNIIEEILDESKVKEVNDPKEINEMLVDKMFFNYLKEGEDIKNEIDFSMVPRVLLVIGVNGVGKTTSIAKLANRYIKQGKKVVLVAADTFRAGAVEQLGIWAKRLGCDIITGEANEDPASVAYKGVVYGKEHQADLIIIDTAGRLQNKTNLMNELGKISRVIKKEYDQPIECFLIIDATTGQNGVLQAKAFKDLINITGIVITKMDGTSKGGIILAIREELGIPVRFIGLGEKMDDLEEFDLDKYLYGLCSGLINDD